MGLSFWKSFPLTKVVLERGGGVYLPLVAVHGHIKERLQVVLERGRGVYPPLVALHGHVKERLQVGGGRARDQAHADLLQVFHIVHRFYQQPLPFERRCCGKSCFSGGALCMQRSQGEEDEGEGNR
uniref:Uncharacterized protein n=1 Tax=Steinernema glaseri TaxID=37863 RepID=A0A1I7Z9W6_9BILA